MVVACHFCPKSPLDFSPSPPSSFFHHLSPLMRSLVPSLSAVVSKRLLLRRRRLLLLPPPPPPAAAATAAATIRHPSPPKNSRFPPSTHALSWFASTSQPLTAPSQRRRRPPAPGPRRAACRCSSLLPAWVSASSLSRHSQAAAANCPTPSSCLTLHPKAVRAFAEHVARRTRHLIVFSLRLFLTQTTAAADEFAANKALNTGKIFKVNPSLSPFALAHPRRLPRLTRCCRRFSLTWSKSTLRPRKSSRCVTLALSHCNLTSQHASFPIPSPESHCIACPHQFTPPPLLRMPSRNRTRRTLRRRPSGASARMYSALSAPKLF